MLKISRHYPISLFHSRMPIFLLFSLGEMKGGEGGRERETNGRIGVCRKGVGRWSDDVYPSLQNYN